MARFSHIYPSRNIVRIGISHSSIRTLILLIVLFFALFLRMHHLDHQVVWYDEADSIASATNRSYFADKVIWYKPLYFQILGVWINWFDVSTFSLRMLSVLFGCLGVIFIYMLGKELYGKNAGLLAAILLTISPFHIYHSQQARQFTLIFLLSTISIYLLVLYLNRQRLRFLFGNLIFTFFLVLTYPSGFLILLAQIVIVMPSRVRFRKVWLIAAIFLFGFAFWEAFYLKINQMDKQLWWVSKPSWGTLHEIFSTFLMGGPDYGLVGTSLCQNIYKSFHSLRIADAAGTIIFVPVFALGILKLFADGARGRALLILFSLPLAAVFAIANIFINFFIIKHLIVILPFFILIMSYAILSLVKKIRIPVFMAFLLISLTPVFVIHNADLHINWKWPANFIKRNAKADDAIILATAKEVAPFMYYFRNLSKDVLSDIGNYGKFINGSLGERLTERGCEIVLIKERSRPNDNVLLKNDFLSKLPFLNDKRRVWLVVSQWVNLTDLDFMTMELEQKGFELKVDAKQECVTTRLFVR